MKRRVALYFVPFFLCGFLFVADIVTAQTIAYRQTNLASNLSNVANNVTPGLVDPWGIPPQSSRSIPTQGALSAWTFAKQM